MNRRDALSRVALLLGGTIVGANLFLEGCKPADKKAGDIASFTADEVAYLDEIAETILPATSTPGAKAAKVGAFMTVMVKDCYTSNDQKIFREGMAKLNEASSKKHNKEFMESTPAERTALLIDIDKESSDYTKKKKSEEPAHYFRLMKELTLLGFFTSETGANDVLRYIESPGRYDPCIDYKKGDRAWAI